ncbi:MAG: class I SAM-dependent methyltransferase [SAR202 cluster bacterium]|nr:class I SAM-dependent methyltransferase [SAR202 cluster bacterium]
MTDLPQSRHGNSQARPHAQRRPAGAARGDVRTRRGSRRFAPPERADAVEGSWDHVAEWYDSMVGEKGSDFHQSVIIPGVVKLLALKPGEAVLDIACGQGAVSNTLYRLGADVTGVDISPQLIEIARRRSPSEITYHVGDARDLKKLDAGPFDAIVSVMSAQNIDPVEPMFAECARLLKPGGRFFMVISHPAFRIPRQSGWLWDEQRSLQVRTVDRYLSPLRIPIDMRPFKRPSEKQTWTYHRPVEAYVTMMGAAGLWTNAMEGWTSHKRSDSGPRADAENHSRDEFPLFLAVRAVKVSAAEPRERRVGREARKPVAQDRRPPSGPRS